MRYLKYAALLGLLIGLAGSAAQAQVRVGIGVGPVGIGIGPAPVCVYGYYSYAPYACAPYGYWGPQYFAGGAFIGAGPWFHGFYGGRPGYGWGHPGYGRPGIWNHGGVAVHGRNGFRSTNVVRGGAVRGGGGFHSGGAVRSGGFHGGGGGHGGGHR